MTDMQSNLNRAARGLNKQRLAEEFKSINRRTISKYSDKELASWQSEYQPDSPQFILAEHEWQRRLMADQIKGSRFAAYIGIIGTIIGAVTTWLITKWP